MRYLEGRRFQVNDDAKMAFRDWLRKQGYSFHCDYISRRSSKISKSDYYFRHVCPSAWNNSAGSGRIFIKFNIWVSENMLRKLAFHYVLTTITGTLHEDRYTFMIISRLILFDISIYLSTAIGLTHGGSTHLHIKNTYITINNTNNKFGKSAGRAQSLRVIPWHFPYSGGKSTEKPQSG
jgi:hypothetical protein